MFVRIMRDKGFNFYRQDIHCQNLFAKHFDISNIKITEKFDLLTAIEVFEHLEDPMVCDGRRLRVFSHGHNATQEHTVLAPIPHRT